VDVDVDVDVDDRDVDMMEGVERLGRMALGRNPWQG
jgi:hypothetical protein